jgi:ABC-type amino acid transport system permease subunit
MEDRDGVESPVCRFYLAICLPLIYLANGLERRLNRRTA